MGFETYDDDMNDNAEPCSSCGKKMSWIGFKGIYMCENPECSSTSSETVSNEIEELRDRGHNEVYGPEIEFSFSLSEWLKSVFKR